MRVHLLFLFIPAILFSSTPSFAATYSWEDEKGTINFTEDPGTIPRKYRKKVRIGDDITVVTPAPSKPQGTPTSAGSEPKTKLAEAPEKPDSTLFGGKTLEQWKNELRELEAKMTAINKRIDEIAVLQKNTRSREEQRGLVEEYNKLIKQFNELKVSYNEKAESARKAGLTVNIEK